MFMPTLCVSVFRVTSRSMLRILSVPMPRTKGYADFCRPIIVAPVLGNLDRRIWSHWRQDVPERGIRQRSRHMQKIAGKSESLIDPAKALAA